MEPVHFNALRKRLDALSVDVAQMAAIQQEILDQLRQNASFAAALQNVAKSQDAIVQLLQQIIGKETVTMKTLTDLQADVAQETTLEASLEALVTGLAAQVATLKTPTTDPATAAAIDGLAQQIEQNVAGLQASVTANTPAAPSPDPAAGSGTDTGSDGQDQAGS